MMVAMRTPLTLVGHEPTPQVDLREPARGRPIAKDPRTLALLQEAELIAKSPATVLILGDSGVGKEVFARYVHDCSPRCNAPFVAVSAAAIPENLLEAELFGYERGAFSGADQAKPGRLELADGGTFLLDEIGELPLTLQAKLLRVLQEREIDRVGGLRPRPVDVRIIATTHRDLATMVAEGTFRADLYYRLNVLRLDVPALSERPLDIAPLARAMLDDATRNIGRAPLHLTEDAVDRLCGHVWPGNVRELIAVVERAAALVPGDSVGADDLRIDRAPAAATAMPVALTLAQMEKQAILSTLDAVGGNREEAARRLGVTSRTLRNKLKAWGAQS